MNKRKTRFSNSILIAIVISLITFTVAFAASGGLDTSFDSDGILLHDPTPAMDDRAYAVAVQPDGKIVVAGYNLTPGSSPSNADVVVTRYNDDGTLDNAFNSTGVVITDAGMFDQARDVLIVGDKILVSGNTCADSGFTQCDLLLIRYNSDGSLDTSFNSDGIMIMNAGAGNNGTYGGLAVDGNGRIVVAGYLIKQVTSPYNFAVYRIKSSGVPDTYFGGTGVVDVHFGSVTRDVAQDLVITPGGKIVVSGYSCNNAGTLCDVAVARLLNGGRLDLTFSGDGKVLTNFGADEFAAAVALQPNGKILIAGYRQSGSAFSMIVARYSTAGILDTTFNKTGRKVINFNINYSEGDYDVYVQPDGKIVTAGYVTIDGSDNFAVVRLTDTGAFDKTFSGDGKAEVDLGYSDTAYSMAVDLDGRYVLAGRSKQALGTDPETYQYYFALTRLMP